MNRAKQTTRLASLLERYSIKQIDVAEGTGATPAMVCRWARGQKVPTMASAMKLVRFLRKYEPELAVEDLFRSAR